MSLDGRHGSPNQSARARPGQARPGQVRSHQPPEASQGSQGSQVSRPRRDAASNLNLDLNLSPCLEFFFHLAQPSRANQPCGPDRARGERADEVVLRERGLAGVTRPLGIGEDVFHSRRLTPSYLQLARRARFCSVWAWPRGRPASSPAHAFPAQPNPP